MGQGQGVWRGRCLSIGRSQNPMDLARIHPALRVSGWRTTTLSGGVGRWEDIDLATFRADCLAIRETERFLFKHERL